MTGETLAGNLLLWSMVTSLSVAMLSCAGWLLVAMFAMAADLLKGRHR